MATDKKILKVIAFDPSSTIFGVAQGMSLDPPCGDEHGFRGIQAGHIKPLRAHDPPRQRVDHMVDEARKLLSNEVKLTAMNDQDLAILIEVTSGKVNANRHGGGGAGLATYGDAVGALRTMVRLCFWGGFKHVQAMEFEENAWIRGMSKEKRQTVAMKYFPDLKELKDTGMDASDAAALAYWYHLQRFKENVQWKG